MDKISDRHKYISTPHSIGSRQKHSRWRVIGDEDRISQLRCQVQSRFGGAQQGDVDDASVAEIDLGEPVQQESVGLRKTLWRGVRSGRNFACSRRRASRVGAAYSRSGDSFRAGRSEETRLS
jgi:hypothetical protein